MYTLRKLESVLLFSQTMIQNPLLEWCSIICTIACLLGPSASSQIVEMLSSIQQKYVTSFTHLVSCIVFSCSIHTSVNNLFTFNVFIQHDLMTENLVKPMNSYSFCLGWSANISDANVADKYSNVFMGKFWWRYLFCRRQLSNHCSRSPGTDKRNKGWKWLSLVYN